MCSQTCNHACARVHQYYSQTTADIPEEYKPAAETEQSEFYSVMKNLWCQKHKEQIKQKGHPSPSALKTINYAENARKKCKKNKQLVYCMLEMLFEPISFLIIILGRKLDTKLYLHV